MQGFCFFVDSSSWINLNFTRDAGQLLIQCNLSLTREDYEKTLPEKIGFFNDAYKHTLQQDPNRKEFCFGLNLKNLAIFLDDLKRLLGVICPDSSTLTYIAQLDETIDSHKISFKAISNLISSQRLLSIFPELMSLYESLLPEKKQQIHCILVLLAQYAPTLLTNPNNIRNILSLRDHAGFIDVLIALQNPTTSFYPSSEKTGITRREEELQNNFNLIIGYQNFRHLSAIITCYPLSFFDTIRHQDQQLLPRPIDPVQSKDPKKDCDSGTPESPSPRSSRSSVSSSRSSSTESIMSSDLSSQSSSSSTGTTVSTAPTLPTTTPISSDSSTRRSKTANIPRGIGSLRCTFSAPPPRTRAHVETLGMQPGLGKQVGR